jgi:hypothetical protein
MSLSEAVATGDKYQILKALQSHLADALDTCGSDRDRAALARQLTDVTNQLDEIKPPEKESAADRIRRAQAERATAQ